MNLLISKYWLLCLWNVLHSCDVKLLSKGIDYLKLNLYWKCVLIFNVSILFKIIILLFEMYELSIICLLFIRTLMYTGILKK